MNGNSKNIPRFRILQQEETTRRRKFYKNGTTCKLFLCNHFIPCCKIKDILQRIRERKMSINLINKNYDILYNYKFGTFNFFNVKCLGFFFFF